MNSEGPKSSQSKKTASQKPAPDASAQGFSNDPRTSVPSVAPAQSEMQATMPLNDPPDFSPIEDAPEEYLSFFSVWLTYVCVLSYSAPIAEDLGDFLNAIHEAEERLKPMFATGSAQNLLPISELRVFQERAEDVVGCELKPLCDFIASIFSRERCKYALTMEDFFRAARQWAQWQTGQRERADFGSDGGFDMESFERHDEEAQLNYFSPD